MRRPVLTALIVATGVALAGCPAQPPMTRGQAAAIADNVQRREAVAWGDPQEILPPGQADAQGRRWWQVRYPDNTQGDMRIILVDDATGWGRMPPPGYAVRVSVQDPAATPATVTALPPVVAEGSLIVLVDDWKVRTNDDEAILEREAARLNALASTTGLFPLFSARHDRSGRTALVYGWQGDRGIARSETVMDWLRLRTGYTRAQWVDLL